MNQSVRGTLALLLLCSTSFGHAQPVADYALEITPSLPPALQANSTGELRFTVTNNGPDSSGGNDQSLVLFSSAQFADAVGNYDVYFLVVEGSAPCVLIPTILEPRPDPLPGLAYLLYPGMVDPGDSVSCAIEYALDPESENASRAVTWTVHSFASIDPDSTNNAVQLFFNVAQPSETTPVPGFSPFTVLLLVGLVMSAGAIAVRRGRQQSCSMQRNQGFAT